MKKTASQHLVIVEQFIRCRRTLALRAAACGLVSSSPWMVLGGALRGYGLHPSWFTGRKALPKIMKGIGAELTWGPLGSPEVLQGFCIISILGCCCCFFNISNKFLKVFKSQDWHVNFASPSSEVLSRNILSSWEERAVGDGSSCLSVCWWHVRCWGGCI